VLISPVGVVKDNPPVFKWELEDSVKRGILTLARDRNLADTIFSVSIVRDEMAYGFWVPPDPFMVQADTFYWSLRAENESGYGYESDTFFILNHRIYAVGKYTGYFKGSDGKVYGYGWNIVGKFILERIEGYPPYGVRICNLFYGVEGSVLPAVDTVSVTFWNDSLVALFRVYLPEGEVDTFIFEISETSGVMEVLPIYPHYAGILYGGVLFKADSLNIYDIYTGEEVLTLSGIREIKSGGIYDSFFVCLKDDTICGIKFDGTRIFSLSHGVWFSPAERKGIVYRSGKAVIYSFEDIKYPVPLDSVECGRKKMCTAGDYLLTGDYVGVKVYSIKGDSLLAKGGEWRIPEYTATYGNGVFLSRYYISFPAER